MRQFLLISLACVLGAAAAQGADAPAKFEHPGEVALVEEDGGFVYRRFPSQLRMYVYAKDKPGKLGCVEVCLNAWPPVWAPRGAPPIGDWTLVERADRGRMQWAYKGQPVYTRFHDTPADATGAGLENGAWGLLEP